MIEIERKFLVLPGADWGAPIVSHRIEQGYLFMDAERSMRIRRTDERYTLTLKVRTDTLARHELETDIDAPQGQKMLSDLCVEPPLQKTRHVIAYQGYEWEVDVFDGVNAGLIVAEVELASEDEEVPLPDWVGPEISHDDRFLNVALSKTPFNTWGTTQEDLVEEFS